MCRLEEVAVGTGLGSFEALSWSMFVWWIRVRVGTLVDANFGVRIVAGAEDAWFQRLVLGCLRGKFKPRAGFLLLNRRFVFSPSKFLFIPMFALCSFVYGSKRRRRRWWCARCFG